MSVPNGFIIQVYEWGNEELGHLHYIDLLT